MTAYETTDELLSRVEQLLRTQNYDEAAQLYGRTQEDIGYMLMDRASTNQGMLKALANMLFKARDYYKAAMACENIGEHEKAAALYARCDCFEMAAEMYAKIGKPNAAAAMFERFGDYAQAARLFADNKQLERAALNYERAGNHFAAGRLYHELQRPQKAIERLQQVPPDSSEFFDAAALMAAILCTAQRQDLAIRKLQAALAPHQVTTATVQLYYSLGTLLLEAGRTAEAAAVFGNIVDFDLAYADAADLLTRAEASGAPTVPTAPATPQNAPTRASAEDLLPPQQTLVSEMEGFDALQSLQLFKELSLTELKRFHALSKPLDLDSGRVFIEQGQAGRALFIILEGTANVERLENGSATLLATLGPGKHVGEMSLLDDAPTSARVTAATPIRLLAISRDMFQQFLESDVRTASRVYKAMLQSMSERLRSANTQ